MKNHNGKNKWKYKNLTIVFFSVVLAVILSRIEVFHSLLLHLGGFGYIGAFIAGMFFVSTFTVATSALILLILAETLSPIEIGLIAGLGAVVGDLLIFRLVKIILPEKLKIFTTILTEKSISKKYFTLNISVGRYQ